MKYFLVLVIMGISFLFCGCKKEVTLTPEEKKAAEFEKELEAEMKEVEKLDRLAEIVKEDVVGKDIEKTLKESEENIKEPEDFIGENIKEPQDFIAAEEGKFPEETLEEEPEGKLVE